MLARRPLFAFVHSTVAQLCTRPRWSPTSDSSMCLSPLDVFARTSSRFSCATRRGMTFLGPTASQKLSEVAPKGSKGGNNALRRRQTRFERVFARNLEQLLRRWGRHYPESIQSDGFIRVKRILSFPPFCKIYDVEFFGTLANRDRLKRFQLRRQWCRKSGIREWFVRLVRGEMEVPIMGVDRGNMKITHLSRLPQEAQCTLTVEDWLLFRHYGIPKSADNLVHLHAVLDNPFDVDYGPSGTVVLVYIDLRAAYLEGMSFYLAKNGDIVTPGDGDGILPPVYFKKAVKVKYESHQLLFRKKAVKVKRKRKSRRVIHQADPLLLRSVESEQPDTDTGCSEGDLP